MSSPDARMPIAVPFTKMEGCGNDYVYVGGPDSDLDDAALLQLLELAPDLAREISDRQYGIGGDGLVILTRATECAAPEVSMHMFNADGSRGDICGNALRCVARLLSDAEPERGDFMIGTDSGVKRAQVERDAASFVAATIDMGSPLFEATEVPIDLSQIEAQRVTTDGPWRFTLEAAGQAFEGVAISMGNPHLVCFVDQDPMDLDLATIGPAFERHPVFPALANIEFVAADEEGRLFQRTWERGSGETLACGSGASAVAVAAVCLGRAERGQAVTVRLRGGDLEIAWCLEGNVTMKGPARKVFTGSYVYAQDI